MHTLKDILHTLLRNPKKSWQTRLMSEWPLVIGDLHKRLCLQKIQDTTLILGVYDQHWMHELYMLSRIIIKKINTELGHPYVERVRFVLVDPASLRGASTSAKASTETTPSTAAPDTAPVLTQQQTTALATVKDKQLQQELMRFFSRCSYVQQLHAPRKS